MGKHFQILKLDATDSTNLYLRDLLRSENPLDYTVVVAEKQLKGRGQMGAVWQSKGGKNLTFSVLKIFYALSVQHQFVLNIAVSLAVIDALNEFSVPNVKVKWPNDIMSGSMKICGILIENVLKGDKVGHSIIGIGLNVNQTDFAELDKASSLKAITGHDFNLDELLQMILERIRFHFEGIEEKRCPNYCLPTKRSFLERTNHQLLQMPMVKCSWGISVGCHLRANWCSNWRTRFLKNLI